LNNQRNRSKRPRRSGNRSGSGSSRRAHTPPPLSPVEDPPAIESFAEWDLGDEILEAIDEMGIVKPTPIQALAIGPVLEGRDVIAKAETGTGKTLAFGAPMMARIDPTRKSVLGLVLSPTRELSEQVHSVLETLGKARGVSVALIVGGAPLNPQVKALQKGAQVVVGTPGRVIDLMNQGFLSFPWAEFAVLDEADKMLEIGFIDDVKHILAATEAEQRQTLLFSATFPPALLDLARESTIDPAEIATSSGVATVKTIRQAYLEVTEDSRPRALSRIIQTSGKDDVFLVFCDRRTDVDRLMRWMERERFSVKALHGGYDQDARFRVMSAFRTGEVKALIATDVASRGLDVDHVTHVVNYGVPRDVSDYTHRIGRTGRAGRSGTAVTLVGPSNERYWRALLRQAPWDIERISSPQALHRSEPPPSRRRNRDDEDEGGRERRPRRSRDQERTDDRRESNQERRPRRRSNAGDERSDDSREKRPRRGRSAQRSDDSNERRPRRRGEREAERGERSRPERREREGRDERSNEAERPKREKRPQRRDREDAPTRPAERPAPPAGATPFGSGVVGDEKPKTGPEKRPKRRSKTTVKSPKDEPRPSPGSNFGAGL